MEQIEIAEFKEIAMRIAFGLHDTPELSVLIPIAEAIYQWLIKDL